MKRRLFVLLVVFFSSIGVVSAQSAGDPCLSQPGCTWQGGSNSMTPPSCVCNELFIDGYPLYIALFAGIVLSFYFYKQKIRKA